MAGALLSFITLLLLLVGVVFVQKGVCVFVYLSSQIYQGRIGRTFVT